MIPSGTVQIVNNASPPQSVTVTSPIKIGNGSAIYDNLIINGTAFLVVNGDAVSSGTSQVIGSAQWGLITGTITNQTDLINYIVSQQGKLNNNPVFWKGNGTSAGDIREIMIGNDLCLQDYDGAVWITRSSR